MYDLIILGAGPGGYVAAERAGERGKKVLLIEKAEIGGVCLNEGCIPTKTLLNSAKHYSHALDSKMFGVHTENATFNLEEAQIWKNKVIDTNRKGILYLMDKYKVEIVKGTGVFNNNGTIQVGDTSYSGKDIIIATGSSPFMPPIPGADSSSVLDSTDLLEITKVPSSLVVIGGGVIGLEFASFFSMLGVKVDIIEMMDEIAPFMEPEFAKNMRRAMKKVKFHLGSKVESIDGNKVNFTKKGKDLSIEAEAILMAVGRKPNITGIGLENLDIEMSRTGIVVNEKMATSKPGIYAIGDVIGKSLFAHSASRMAEVVVNTICGDEDSLDYDIVPWAVYTHPEAASCGLTEDEAVKRNINIKTATLQMRISARYFAENGMTPGLCKVVVDGDTDKIIGIHLLGSPCSEMIFGAALIMQSGMTTLDIKHTIFPHPSVSEVIRETVLAIEQ
ncbi:MAG: dihydrolipoyl dehydrogenase [Spirochaetia bacterium]|jgi:dihydrolipoamide dehydrogenase|nr:dihydrolipoyl dehydrogenase [Spirochaetia bacterium]